MMELPAWVSAYVGLPFKEGGRHRDGLDFYGLLRRDTEGEEVRLQGRNGTGSRAA